MTKKDAFIHVVEWLFEEYRDVIADGYDADATPAFEYFEDFKKAKSPTQGLTQAGKNVLFWMQEHKDEYDNLMTCKVIGEGLFISGRSVSGTMRKLISDEYVTKNASSPIQYSLTEKGENYVDKD